MGHDFGVNQALVEELYYRYQENPTAVPEAWRTYFAQLDAETGAPPARGGAPSAGASSTGTSGVFSLPPTAEVVPPFGQSDAPAPSPELEAAVEKQARVSAMVNAYRVRGHLFAQLDPLGLQERPPFDLSLGTFGLQDVDPETVFAYGNKKLPLREIVRRLQDTYCRTIGAEFTFIEDPEERRWLQHRMEDSANHVDLPPQTQVSILRKLTDAETFERFLHSTYIGAKRFSAEGGESVIPMLELIVDHAAPLGVEEVVIGMAHRGRLNVLINVLELPPHDILAAFEDNDPERYLGSGDVKYHLGHSTDRYIEGRKVHLTLSFNPSHLEFVNPVVEGRVRAKQDRRGDGERKRVMPLLIHGDAAFIAQGVVAETLNLANLRAYETGGTMHVVINNQIGFTTAIRDARSTRYCTDITRMLRCPVFHVNGEDPEAVAHVAQLATEYRQRYGRDVVVDLYCYRKWGHNEGDEPRFTQPVMYEAIEAKKTVREVYVESLRQKGHITEQTAQEIQEESRARFERALEEVRHTNHHYETSAFGGLWAGYSGGADLETADQDTAVPAEKLTQLMDKLTELPEGFSALRQIKAILRHRRKAGRGEAPMDWGSAETLAYASLLDEGVNIRMTGQDVERGTFSHRHAVMYDAQTGKSHVPLSKLSDDQGHIEIYDSSLSEAGVLGFEYGYSLDSPDGLVIWEAQFGDFANGAQVLIDQFISSSEDKWHRLSGLVMLLPHGFEGQGPEHSSARLERFLSLCAEDNMMVCNLTTASQIFHALRRQVKRPWRKPLVVMSPKSLLRAEKAASSLDDLAKGSFQRIIPDHDVPPKKTKRVLFCSGKVYYDLVKGREEKGRDDVAIVRLEQLYPIRVQELRDIFSGYADGTELVWVQEEPFNSGAWYYVNAHVPQMLTHRFPVRCVSRPSSASPATGSKQAHLLEQQQLVDDAFADLESARKPIAGDSARASAS
ncbi:MAG TPA: 2-oxoglutarate dehydrogenase E1 component [Sandaracinaceae bacterium LLY-WYZ-13_1]|nr:2-oxoglutarate dehydrogenase E1 component [Sandaracinaceae bacterium LLY-WYZ-13_1]